MEDLRGEINGRMEKRLEEMLNLAESAGEEIRLLYSAADSSSRRRQLFEILQADLKDRPDREDLFFVLVAAAGEELAWSGEGYLSLDNIRSAAPSGPSLSVRLFRGNIITAAIITKKLAGIGDLLLIDRLEVMHHLGERYARSGRFIDRMERLTGSDVTLYAVREREAIDAREGDSIFPLVFHGERIGTWSIGQLDREGYLARLRSREGKLLGLLLLFPLIASFIILKSWLRRYFLDGDRPRRDGRPAYILFLGLTLFLLRLLLLEASFPASLTGGALFSSKYFATGLLQDGSMSAGEFFISGLFISLFLLHICPLVDWRRETWKTTGRMGSLKLVAGSAFAIFLSLSAPLAHERLLKDSLFSVVVELGFLHSAVTVVWELGFFLLVLSVSLLTAYALRPAWFFRGRDSRSLSACALLWLALLSTSTYMALHAYGEEWRGVFMVLEGGMVLVGGCLISVAVSAAVKGGEKRSSAWINLPMIFLLSILSAGFIYPGILRYRHLALEEAGEELLEEIGAPYENRVAFVLEEAADDLLDKSGEIFSESREVQGLGFFAWANSRLSRLGQRTSLVIYDSEGSEISEFSLTDLELDKSFSAIFLQRARELDDPFIYHGYSGGSEFYSAVVPYWENGKLKNFLTITLPMDLEERLGGGPIRLFLDETDKGQLDIPEPLELEVYSAPGEEETSGWQSRYDDGGTLRYYRKRIEVGGSDKVAEIAFRKQEIGESLSMINFLFLLHVLLTIILLGILSGGRWALQRARFRIESFQKKLTAALVVFSFIPALLFGLIGSMEIRKRIKMETRSRAVEGLEAFVNVVRRDLDMGRSGPAGEVIFYPKVGSVNARPDSPEGEPGNDLVMDSRYVREISGTIGRDFLVYLDNRLVSTSQKDLAQAGIVPATAGEESFVDLVLRDRDYAFERQSLGNYQYLVASRKLTAAGEANPVIVSTPLLWRQGDVDREMAHLTYLVLLIITSTFLLSWMMGAIVGKLLARPISELKDAFEKVGSGNFTVRIDERRKDEFGRLFTSFGAMSRQLETSQRRLSEEKARVDGVLQAVGAGIMAFGSDGKLKVVNARAVSLVGPGLDDQIGMGVEELAFEDEGWMELVRGVRDVSRSRGEVQREFLISGSDGPLTIRMVANLLVDSGGGTHGVVVAFEDISDSIRSQKIMAWGEMARQVAHEIKNPLTPMRLSIQHLHKTYKDGAPDFQSIIEDEVKVILREIDRLRRIAGDFARYSRPATEEVHRVEVTAVIREVMELYDKEHGEITYSFEMDGGEVWAMASEEGLKKVLVNLIENARAAVTGRGRLGVVAESKGEGESRTVTITVSDSGKGIAEEDLGRIFDPNFSTRSGGAGLGLAICRRIVEEWGGEIEITSREREGTVVTVRLREG